MTKKQLQEEERVEFTEDMRKTHTILFPEMLPIHFKLIEQILRNHGYNCVLLQSKSQNAIDQGLQSVHNDTCYPATLVIGQMLEALQSGQYEMDKVALLITQTGGGCRASNYVHLLRKALKKNDLDYVPVISLNFSGLEKNSGFKITVPILQQVLYALLLGDLLMHIANQCRPYEIVKGETDELCNTWTMKLAHYFKDVNVVSSRKIKRFYREILGDFAAIKRTGKQKIRVGIVGEIYVKYSPFGNHDLEAFLHDEDVEIVMPGLLGFCLYTVENARVDYKLYGTGYKSKLIYTGIYHYLCHKEKEMLQAINEHGVFRPWTPFPQIAKIAGEYVNKGVKMGEGWLLTAEMAELIQEGVHNIICTQPFGCLPNHIIARGKMRFFKEKHPEANIISLDFDASASQVNLENRIKLMLAHAKATK